MRIQRCIEHNVLVVRSVPYLVLIFMSDFHEIVGSEDNLHYMHIFRQGVSPERVNLIRNCDKIGILIIIIN